MKKRALFGIFPVWIELLDDGGCNITGFWSSPSVYLDQNLAAFCHFITSGAWNRDEFAFFPYEENGCKYWIQALMRASLTPKV